MVRRDAILAMANLGNWFWLADQIRNFRFVSPLEQHCFVMASYFMSDHGKHWRDHIKGALTPVELVIRDWAAAKKTSDPAWQVPL